MARVQVPSSGRQIVDLVLDHLAAEAAGRAFHLSEIILVLRAIAADDEPARPFLPDQILRDRVGAHRIVGDDVKDVDAALLLAERGRARSDVHDHRVLRLGQVGDGEEIGGLEIGDDKAITLRQHLFRLGDNVAVDGDDRLFELEGVADEIAGLVRLFQHQARALDAFVGNRLLGIRERQRLLILLAEIDDTHIFQRRAAGGGRRGVSRGASGVGSRRRHGCGGRDWGCSRGCWRSRRLGQHRQGQAKQS